MSAQDPPGSALARLPAGPGRVGGIVTDSAGTPLASAAITLRSALDSALVTGALTEKDRRFRIEGLPAGDYLLHVSLIGYRARSSETLKLSAERPAVDLGSIALKPMAVELEGLQANAERSAVVIEADRTTYNTKAMPVASSGTAIDVLRAVPEIEVDVNDNVKLRGNQAVAIHLNGRPAPLRGEQLANFLRQLPGNRIQRVEVMPNPSAKHDPEGMGGIVNIVLADDLDLGLSGSMSVNASTRNRQYVNGRLNYQKGRLTFFTGLGVNTYRNEGRTYDLRQNLIAVPITMIEQDGRTDNRSRGNEDTRAHDLRSFALVAGEPVDLPDELTLNRIDAGSGNLYMQADYFQPLGKARVDLGYRAYRRDQDNDNDLRIFASEDADDPRSVTRSGYAYEEVFHSLYGTWGRTAGKFGMQLGLRAELSTTNFESRVGGASFDRSYNTLYPSVNLSYNPARGRTARVLYSKRISRPAAWYLDPYVPSVDPLNQLRGNADLRPTYTQSLSMDYSWSGTRGTLRLGPYVRYSTDVWERIRTVDAEGVATSRWENAASSSILGTNFTLSLPPTRRVSGSVNVNVYHDDRDGTNIASAYHRSAVLWSMSGNLGMKLTPTLTAQGFGIYFPSQSILQGRASGYAYMSLALRKQIAGQKGTVSLNINDPFNLQRYDSSTRMRPTSRPADPATGRACSLSA